MILSTGMSLSTKRQRLRVVHFIWRRCFQQWLFFFLLFFVCDLLLCSRYSVTEAVPTLVLV